MRSADELFDQATDNLFRVFRKLPETVGRSMCGPNIDSLLSLIWSYVPELIARQELENAGERGVLLKRQLVRWLVNPSTAASLEQAYFQFDEQAPKSAAEIFEAIHWLVNFRASYEKSPEGWPTWFTD